MCVTISIRVLSSYFLPDFDGFGFYLSVDVIPLLGKGSFTNFTNDELVVSVS